MSNFYYTVAVDFSQLKTKLQSIFLLEFRDLFAQKGTHDYVNIEPDRIRGIRSFDWLEQNICPVDAVKFFVAKANSFGGVHIDGCIHDFPFIRCAVNLPLFNCGLGDTVWYKDRSDPDGITRLIKEHRKGYNFYLAKDSLSVDNWEHVETMGPLTEPRLIRTDSWHNVDNRANPSHRVVASFRFRDNPEYEVILKKFSSSC